MTHVYDPDSLDIELKRRLKEVKDRLDPITYELNAKNFEEKTEDDNKKRVLLLRILNDLQ